MSRRLIMILVAAVAVSILTTVGILVYFVILAPGKAPAATAETAKVGGAATGAVVKGEYHALDHFVTDLADQDPLRYVDVSISLNLKDAAAVEEAKKADPQIRSIVLNELRGRKAAELAGQQGQTTLAQVLKSRLSQVMGESLLDVYITDLVVQ